GVDGNQQHQPFYDYSLIRFVGTQGAASRFLRPAFERKVADLLTDEQRERLKQAKQDRAAAIHQRFLSFLVMLIDREVFLTSEQYPVVVDSLNGVVGTLTNSLYSFSPQTYYLTFSSLSNAVARIPKKVFNDAQKAVLDDLHANTNGGQYLTFMTNDGTANWYTTLRQHLQAQRTRFAHASEVRVAHMSAELQLNDAAARHLSLAASGAATEELFRWKRTAEQELQQWEQQLPQMGGGNFGFSINIPQMSTLEDNNIWTSAVSAISNADRPGDIGEARKERILTGYKNCVLGNLDQELWLTPDQAAKMDTLLQQTLASHHPDSQEASFNNYMQYIRELCLLAIPLYRIEEAQLAEILDESQLEAWKQMKGEFRKNQDYINLPIRSGGEFMFQIP
ncbi:MAG: hypothetical protein KDA85_13875, partial [Planctomycetaceae bacterium]|nr:hypothetical protein [Planctomycetaceae bacterium]